MEYNELSDDIINVLKEAGMTKEEIELSTPEELFRVYLEWEGIIGYASKLIAVLDGLRGAQKSE